MSILLLGAALGAAPASAGEWPFLGCDSARGCRAERGPLDFNSFCWAASVGADEDWIGAACPVSCDGRVFAVTREYVDFEQVADIVRGYSLADGAPIWAAKIEPDVLDSYSSPAVDPRTDTVYCAVGYSLYAFEAHDGDLVFQAPLDRPVVNCSPVVSRDLVSSGGPANRVFVTDFDASSGAKLYAINVDPFNASNNPYAKGARVWTVTLGAATNSTPAYANGRVYVASANGVVKCIDALSGAPVWSRNIATSGYSQYVGFYGGVTVYGGAVYAASYVFHGGQNNSGLFKLDAASGAILWVASCERTSSLPIVADSGRIYLAGGLDGFGAQVKLQCFQDHGSFATLVWDTYADTNGALRVGGWTNQPVLAGGKLFAGVPPQGQSFDVYSDLLKLNPDVAPSDPGFIVQQVSGIGGPPAVVERGVLSIGDKGLQLYGSSAACVADLDGDGVVALGDLARVLASYGQHSTGAAFDAESDLNSDGVIDLGDLAAALAVYGQTCP